MALVEQVKIKELFDCQVSYLKPLLDKYTYPWQVLPELKGYIQQLINEGLGKWHGQQAECDMGGSKQPSAVAAVTWATRQCSDVSLSQCRRSHICLTTSFVELNTTRR
jgi:hypothetical protein